MNRIKIIIWLFLCMLYLTNCGSLNGKIKDVRYEMKFVNKHGIPIDNVEFVELFKKDTVKYGTINDFRFENRKGKGIFSDSNGIIYLHSFDQRICATALNLPFLSRHIIIKRFGNKPKYKFYRNGKEIIGFSMKRFKRIMWKNIKSREDLEYCYPKLEYDAEYGKSNKFIRLSRTFKVKRNKLLLTTPIGNGSEVHFENERIKN